MCLLKDLLFHYGLQFCSSTDSCLARTWARALGGHGDVRFTVLLRRRGAVQPCGGLVDFTDLLHVSQRVVRALGVLAASGAGLGCALPEPMSLYRGRSGLRTFQKKEPFMLARLASLLPRSG